MFSCCCHVDCPKQIYRCDFPDCNRSFVRQDLCIRHRERHTTLGSQLQKRDSFAQAATNLMHSREPAGPAPLPAATKEENIGARNLSAATPAVARDNKPVVYPNASAYRRVSISTETGYQPLTPLTAGSSSDNGLKRSENGGSYTISPTATRPSVSSSAFSEPSFKQGDLPGSQNPPNSNVPTAPLSGNNTLGSTNSYVPQQDLSMYPTSNASRDAFDNLGFDALGSVSASDSNAPLDSMTTFPYPVFGGETYNRSPFAMADDFAAWLFGDPGNGSPVNYSNMLSGYADSVQNSFFINDPTYKVFPSVVPEHPMSVTSLLETTPPEAIISEEKRQDVIHLISTRFNETAHSACSIRKEALLDGDIDAEGHILSLQMMQTYLNSYWLHFHAQLPILHKPTFNADRTPNLLLLAVMAIGAATLDRIHGENMVESAADLANFLAWHIRWEIFMDVDFRPPAKLWVFQTLLLLEVYEKMFSTRALHERAHIHHDTTLTLMRRGSSLIGRSPLDSPGSHRDDRTGRSGTGTSDGVGEREDSWSHWIRTEATRRVAFGAFVVDSIHATMFGHSAKMVAHEMRLPLPCDEALWSAPTAAEVSRMQASLQANGVMPIMFLDGLKKTLTGQKVRTNAFGRTIIMAGLLSVSWHMNQRDLQVSTLGVTQALGGRDKWRSALLRAFDNWKRDFDEAVAESGRRGYRNSFSRRYQVEEDDTFETRTVLHHLAHMASHVDIVDCQIFAGANRLLGRSITPKDYATAREKMTERWATRPEARDAAFYGLRFLRHVLLPATSEEPMTLYSARDDFLLNRAWVVYFAALVVWCYGFALEGPIASPPELPTVADKVQDMQNFLNTVGAVREPNDLEYITGRNRCMGLLMLLRESFSRTRWELLHEAANLLGNCVQKLKGEVRR